MSNVSKSYKFFLTMFLKTKVTSTSHLNLPRLNGMCICCFFTCYKYFAKSSEVCSSLFSITKEFSTLCTLLWILMGSQRSSIVFLYFVSVSDRQWDFNSSILTPRLLRCPQFQVSRLICLIMFSLTTDRSLGQGL